MGAVPRSLAKVTRQSSNVPTAWAQARLKFKTVTTFAKVARGQEKQQ